MPLDELFVYSLRWGNPYKDPPNGKPRILAEMCTTTRHPPPVEFQEACSRLSKPGDGYCVCFSYLQPRQVKREWSQERKAARRRQILELRIQKKAPMFAEQFIAEAVSKKPNYYDGLDNPDTAEAREQELQRIDDLYRFYVAHIGELLCHLT